ncbi:hypothetical protein FV194_17130 [Pseudomonas aeruginosa]|nr:hypothetical protein CDG41_23245 [Pseudomonas aeruginosa]OWK96151.1 hypothetical protein L999_004300 [Pseudomonas aeruginosa 148]ASD07497.1 hypothetical protein CD797_24010 [Pseudomonas aeruginosa]MBF3176419.1 hypothetical protein [Pseudomonas aeruginosa]MBF3189591.1 hypothetical protein [Pseudomonas aeruginosa]
MGHPARHAGAAWGGERHEQGTDAKKETRRKPLKTAQEKRLAKRAKKHAPAAPLGTPSRS